MKTSILSLILAVGLVGCTTTPNGSSITPDTVNKIARLAAFGSAAGVLESNPASRADLERARVIIATLVSAKQWDIAQLAGAFQQGGFKDLHGDKGVLIVTGAILPVDLSSHRVDLRSPAYAEQAILGALDGLNMALGNNHQ